MVSEGQLLCFLKGSNFHLEMAGDLCWKYKANVSPGQMELGQARY